MNDYRKLTIKQLREMANASPAYYGHSKFKRKGDLIDFMNKMDAHHYIGSLDESTSVWALGETPIEVPFLPAEAPTIVLDAPLPASTVDTTLNPYYASLNFTELMYICSCNKDLYMGYQSHEFNHDRESLIKFMMWADKMYTLDKSNPLRVNQTEVNK